MKTISRYIMTLALLITAVTGAWAEELTVYDGTANNTYVPVYGFYADAYLKCQTVYPATELAAMAGNSINSITYYATTPALKAWGATFQVHVIEVADATISSFNDLSTATLVYEGTLDGTQSTMAIPFTTPYNYQGGNLLVSVSLTTTGSYQNIYWGGETVEGASVQGYSESSFDAISATQQNFLPKTTFTYGPSGIKVTTNAEEGETTFTEATFNMPAYDATAEYELVRDMSIQMTATMGDGTNGVRYRVKKAQQGQGYEPADMNMTQVLALVAVNDGIEQKPLTLDQDYFCRIYKLDEQTHQPEGDGVKLSDFDFAPGLYALKAFAKDDSDYAGETALSNTFKLFQGYEVEVAAKEFITYYKDEALYVEDEAAELYTIQSVNGDQAVLSDKSDAMPSNTPMLVYNKSNETKVILLIPCAEPDMALTVAPEFQGTLTGTTIAASTDAQTNYALNGKQFVFVKDAIEVGPNKAWLSINTGVPSARITLVFDETTGVSEKGIVNSEKFATATWYDLNGRKVNAPSKKGVYIMNGKKVVIK